MGDVAEGRAAFDRHAWQDAYTHLSSAADGSLEIEDLERLAVSAYLIGRAEEAEEHWARGHNQWTHSGNVQRAARCTFWLAFGLLNRGELASGSGWVDRGLRLLDEQGVECVEHGYLRYCVALRSTFEGDVRSGYAGFSNAAKIGEQFGDRELTTLARIGEGRCLIYLAEISQGVALLDEAMVAVGEQEVSPIAAGDAYCTVIEGVQQLFDLHRMRTWTAALSRWCESQPQLVLYRGRCLVHRAEILLLHGAWTDAIEEIDNALGRLAEPLEAVVLADAFYLRGELHRLRGQFTEAAGAYRQANELGREPQPGLALLRLAEGRLHAAAAAIRRVLHEAQDPISRSRLLSPYVEIVLATGDIDAARKASEELGSFAAEFNSPLLAALAASATGWVRLAEDDAGPALAPLRQAWRNWRDLEVPYEAARMRVRLAQACKALGDDGGAEMELDAARSVFESLGAAADLAAVNRMSGITEPIATGLTPREVEVLRLLATGRTNRAIARELMVSEKTVASHVSHIFTKLQLPSRAAATAYAYEHGII
jgi:DNA-binding CsgD family transcriptional regulator